MRKMLVALLSLLGMVGCAGSRGQTVNATVTCGPFGQATSDLGLVNTFGGSLGTLGLVSEENKSVQRRMTITPSEITEPNPALQSSTLVKGASLSFALSAKIPETVEAALKSDVSANTKFVMKNLRRREIPDPIAELRNNPRAVAAMREQPGDLFLFGQAVFFADSLDIDLERSNTSSGSANVLKYGAYTVNVAYSCKNAIENLAPGGAPMFWKYVQVRYDDKLGKIVLDSRPFDASKYSWLAR